MMLEKSKRTLVCVVALAFGLAGCAASYESQVRSRLVAAGLPPPVAGCMAGRLVDSLSRDQLRSLGRLAGLAEAEKMPADEIVERARALLDPEVYAAVTGAGLGCALAV